jgi:hypothetical protein
MRQKGVEEGMIDNGDYICALEGNSYVVSKERLGEIKEKSVKC